MSIIKLIHLLFIMFIILVPLISSDSYILFLHLLAIPTMMFHWLLNSDKCILTEIEKRITKRNDTFIGSVLGPIYSPQPHNIRVTCVVLWFMTFNKFLI